MYMYLCVCLCVCKGWRESKRGKEKEAFKELEIQSISTILTFLPFLSSITLKFVPIFISQVSLYTKVSSSQVKKIKKKTNKDVYTTRYE